MTNSFLERKKELTFSKGFTEKDFETDSKIFSRLSLILYPKEQKELEDYYFYLRKSGKPEKEQVELLKAWLIPKLDKEHAKMAIKKFPRQFFMVKNWLGI